MQIFRVTIPYHISRQEAPTAYWLQATRVVHYNGFVMAGDSVAGHPQGAPFFVHHIYTGSFSYDTINPEQMPWAYRVYLLPYILFILFLPSSSVPIPQIAR